MSGSSAVAAPPPPALVECALNTPQPSRAQFITQPIPELSPTPLFKGDLCDQRWQWYQVQTAILRSRPVSTRSAGTDGVVRTSTSFQQVSETAAAVILFDSVWTRQANRFPTSDIMVVNGKDNMPNNWDRPEVFDPVSAAESAPAQSIWWRPGVDSLTLTVGYNASLSDDGCAVALQPTLFVGVRCNWGQAIACRYEIGAQRVPRLAYDGDVVEASLGAAEYHHFALSVGSFDTVTASVLRLDAEIGFVDEATGEERTHDFALRGSLVAQYGACTNVDVFPPPPPPSPPPSPPPLAISDGGGSSGGEASSSLGSLRVAPITNASLVAAVAVRCTTEAEAGQWVVSVAASARQGPEDLAFEANSIEADCRYGYVGPLGMPIYTSPSVLGSLPQCNPGGANNELKPTRPRYRLTIGHSAFSDAPLANREVRPTCMGYGQWRRFTITAEGEATANVHLRLSTAVSRLFLREEAAPTADQYDVRADESRSVSASPCEATASRTWHVAIYLGSEAEAMAAGLAADAGAYSPIQLEVALTSARKQIGDTVTPTDLGGDGSVCCGSLTTYVVNVPSAALSLRVQLNVTVGSLRAVYLKAATCAQYPIDVDGQQCDRRTPYCHMTWYLSYDRYTGQRRYATSNSTVVPAGGDFPDKRTSGEWYIGVQDAGSGVAAQFAMHIDALSLATTASQANCDRYGRYDCSNTLWKVPPDLIATSAAGARRAASPAPHGGWSWRIAPTLVAAASAALLTRGAGGRTTAARQRRDRGATS